MIRTVLFDLGNVLVNFSHERMCSQIGALCGRSSGDLRNFLFGSELQHRFERGEVSAGEFHRAIECWAGHAVDAAALFEAASDIFELDERMLDIVKALKAEGRRLVLLSNTSEAHFEFVWRRFDVLQELDDYVLSFQVGALKPAAAIFEAALRSIRCDPAECFYTDDISEYVHAAGGFGLQAEVFRGADTLLQHLEQRSLRLKLNGDA